LRAADFPALFPELIGDAEWERLLRDERSRPELSKLLDETEEQLRHDVHLLARDPISNFFR
jgi:hypothetical protein